jgi:hypothetical protein
VLARLAGIIPLDLCRITWAGCPHVVVRLDHPGTAPAQETRYGSWKEEMNVKVPSQAENPPGSSFSAHFGLFRGPNRCRKALDNFVRFIAVSRVYTGRTGAESVADAEP